MDTNKPTNKTYLEDRFKKIKDMTGSKRLDPKIKSRFYEYMTELYRRLEHECEELQRIREILCEYRDTEYALSECISVHDYLHKRSSAALDRILSRQRSRNIKDKLS